MKLEPSFLLLCFLAVTTARAEPVQQATGPTEIPRGNILVLDVGGPQRWIIMPSSGPEFHIYAAAISGDKVMVAVHRLPIGGDPGPDDPDDPPPEKDLAELVDSWADDVGDPATRPRLAAVYQFSVQLIDSGALPDVAALMSFQSRADTLALGENKEKWTPFLQRVKDHLDAHVENDLKAYRAAWVEISDGLARGMEPSVVEYWRRYEAATRRQP